MTYIPSGSTDNLAVNFESITSLHNSTYNIACNVGTVLPMQSSRSLHASDTYSVSSGEITLPSGYFYLLRGGVGAGLPTNTSSFAGLFVKYRFYNTNTSAFIGRRGTLTWQENPLLTGGDDYAIALVDASSSTQTIEFRITDKNGTNIKIDNTNYAYYDYAGLSRIEIWKWS